MVEVSDGSWVDSRSAALRALHALERRNTATTTLAVPLTAAAGPVARPTMRPVREVRSRPGLPHAPSGPASYGLAGLAR